MKLLAGRLVNIASLIVDEYQKFKLIEAMQSAASAAANRPRWDDAVYANAVREVRKQCNSIIEKTALRLFPLDTSSQLEKSGFGVYLPHRIAAMLIAGLPDSKQSGISSGEIGMYIDGSTKLISSLKALIYTAHQLDVEHYNFPQDRVSLDIVIPRQLIDNGMISMSSKMIEFGELIQSIDELASGRREDPRIICLSTTDPVLSVAIIPATAYGVLLFYKLILEVVEKHLNIWKAIRDLKKTGLQSVDVSRYEKDARASLDVSVEKAIEDAISRIKPKVDASRVNEIKIELHKRTLEIVATVSGGARIHVSVENRGDLSPFFSDGEDNADGEIELTKQIEEQKQLEVKINNIALSSSDVSLIAAPIQGDAS